MSMQSQRKMLETRAELIGVKPKVLAARVKKRLENIKAQIDGIGAAFEDIDNSIVTEGRELLFHFETYENRVNEAVNWLNESAGAA